VSKRRSEIHDLPAMSGFQRIIFRFSRTLPVTGFHLRATLPTALEAERISAQVDAGLALLARHSPMRHAYLQRDLPRILVGATHNLGECHAQAGLCLLQFDYVVAQSTTPAQIALLLTHEGMHARLARAGVAYLPESRARIERLCAKAEWVLANRFGDRELIAGAERHRAWPAEMWTDEAERERGKVALRRLGVEGRIGYWMGAFAAWWAGRHRRRAA
jgi:hypothetical protein